MVDQKKRMKELIAVLNQASKAYYQEAREIMSDHEYDALYDELSILEKESGMVLSGSPTQKVGYPVLSDLPKVNHARPMLSLDKTKSREDLAAWLGDRSGILSWKMDGLTVVMTYEDGKLVQALTRGNGEVGEEITQNARFFEDVPLTISYPGHLTVRGEAVISYADFDRINQELPVEEQYKNPRNLCSGSVRVLNSEVTAQRHVHFITYTLVESDRNDWKLKSEQIQWLSELGFDTVEYVIATGADLPEKIEVFANKIETNAYPSDGLVLTIDDLELSASLGRTAKFPRDSMAFKWQDEMVETVLRSMEWKTSRTGLINPVAIFDPIELEGTTVQRASVHNLSIIRELKLGIGDRVKVYKANMIIPQIAENLTGSDNLEIPEVCPRCGAPTAVEQSNEAQVLVCTNPDCPAKIHRAFVHFASRPAMDIEGLSEATLDRFIEAGFLENFADIFRLADHRDAIAAMDGFGEKSADKLLSGIENARHAECYRVLASIGIPGVGPANAKILSRHFHGDLLKIMDAEASEIEKIDGFAGIGASKICAFFRNEENRKVTLDLLKVLDLKEEEAVQESPISGKTLVITGSLQHFDHRDQLVKVIEEKGGKVSGSVSSKTAYLVNNDVSSTSGKNKKAKELGIPIISEEELIKLLNS